jgi:hypothetical protein
MKKKITQLGKETRKGLFKHSFACDLSILGEFSTMKWKYVSPKILYKYYYLYIKVMGFLASLSAPNQLSNF